MGNELKSSCDDILQRVATGDRRAPGVVAMITDQQKTIHEGTAGKRRLDEDGETTADSVFDIFSMTNAVSRTAILRFVESGKLELDAPAKNDAPDIGTPQVIVGYPIAIVGHVDSEAAADARASMRAAA